MEINSSVGATCKKENGQTEIIQKIECPDTTHLNNESFITHLIAPSFRRRDYSIKGSKTGKGHFVDQFIIAIDTRICIVIFLLERTVSRQYGRNVV